MISFSIVIPVFNESENIINLIKEITEVLKSKICNYEIIIVDDCSTDTTHLLIEEITKKNNFIRLLKNNSNKGQSYSIYKGIGVSKYKNIITLDGDGQNDPSDILKILNVYESNISLDLVGGLRINRKDNLTKIISSKIANTIRKRILKDNCDDTGCSLKFFKKDIFLTFPFFDGIHRFIPALFSAYGSATEFIPVNHRKRNFGKSNYGTLNRMFNGIRDIYKVKNIIKNIKYK